MFQICKPLQVFYHASIADQSRHRDHSHFAKDQHLPCSSQYLGQARLQHSGVYQINRETLTQKKLWQIESGTNRKEYGFTTGISMFLPSTSRLTCHGKSAQVLSTISLTPSLAYNSLLTNCILKQPVNQRSALMNTF